MDTRTGCIGTPTRVGEPLSGTGCATVVEPEPEQGPDNRLFRRAMWREVGSNGCELRWEEGDGDCVRAKKKRNEVVVDGSVGR